MVILVSSYRASHQFDNSNDLYSIRSECLPLVKKVPYALYKGYLTRSKAEIAWNFVLRRGWVRPSSDLESMSTPCNNQNHDDGSEDEASIIPVSASQALDPDPADNRWYVVYRGLRPGVYAT